VVLAILVLLLYHQWRSIPCAFYTILL